ncbi:MAG: PEP-CTERM sorting domain-containing protein [Gemmataceae bacterium]|nr:PEP-CTERM sorting domain-containing protein [Gemmataceae bacterium]
MAPRWKALVPTAGLTAVTFTLTSQTASALFPPVWPRPQPPTVITVPPPPVDVVVVPPVVPPVIIVPPVVPVVPVVPVTPPPPTGVPEPSTLITGMAGLAAAAGWAARRRKKFKGDASETK